MYDFLTQIGVQPLVADFILHPEWLHVGSAFLLTLMILAVAYLLRLDLDPYVLGRHQPFSAIIERLVFYPVVIGVLLWTYYHTWNWPDTSPEGLYFNKFTLGCGLLLVLVVGRALVHFIHTERDRWDFFDQLPFYLLIEFQFLVPLVYYYALERNGLMPKDELGFSLACIFLCYFAVRWLLGRPTHLPRNPVAPWLWLFIAYMMLTVIFLPYRLAAVKNVIQWVAWAACFLMAFAYIPDRRRRDAVLLTAIVAVTVSTLWGFWKYFDAPLHLFGMTAGTYPEDHMLAGQTYFYKTPSAGRYFLLAGFFANPNYFGEYLAMTLFITLGMLLATDSRNLQIFLAVALAINSFEMVALFNRAGWLGIFVGIPVVLAGMFWGRVSIFKRVSKLGLVAGLIGLVLILALTGAIFNRRETDETPLSLTPWERLRSMTDFEGDETFRNRLTMWRAARFMVTDPEAFPERLIFGGGFGFYEVMYLPYQTQVLETYNFDDWFHNVIPTFRAHSDHIQMIVEAGLIGTALYALAFILFFVYGFRFLVVERDAAQRFYALGIIGASASCVAIALFSFPLHKMQHGGLLFTAMGFLVVEIAARNRLRKEKTEPPATPPPVEAPRRRRKRKKSRKETATSVERAPTFPPEYYIRLHKKIPLLVALPVVIVAILLTVWGVYTQIINFKSHHLVVKGITALRSITNEQPEYVKHRLAQTASDFFWYAYRLDPTNGRAEFFNGFALTKKATYEDAKAGTEHLEEGQLLYPQSDTHYALAMGYEGRRRLALERAALIRDQIAAATTDEGVPEAIAEAERLEADAEYSLNRAIDSYMTAAQYYPVKVEYYKELVRLLEGQRRFEEMIFWCERALVVDDWLLKKPPIRWQFYLWLGKAHRALGGTAIREGDVEGGLDHWRQAEEALLSCIDLRRGGAIYQPYYELGQIYEAHGDRKAMEDRSVEALGYYERARDMYTQVFNRKDAVRERQPPFDYAYLLLARIYERMQEPERALNFYRGVLTRSLYSPETDTYQLARERIHELTGVWEGRPRPGEESSEGEPGSDG